ncbi:MAG: beta-N-acetylhexosaminidase, partial [Alphaproteobacteria bacterium]
AELTANERAFFKSAEPWGFILFQRNCVSRAQVRELTDDLRALTARDPLPVLIDEEGGRVQRLKPPEWRRRPAMRTFGKLYEIDRARGLEAARLNAQLIAEDLAELGINVDCVPSLDVPVPGGHDIIGDRAFGEDPAEVAALGRAVAETVLAAGVLPVIKHMPGHGRATLDTHEALPRVSTPRAELSRTDFAPFKALNDQALGMSAHVIFETIDPDLPATLSPKVISEIIRGEIGFQGLLMTDDLNMNALQGTVASRASRALSAGIDVILHCNGKLGDMEEIAKIVPKLAGKSKARADAAIQLLKRPRTQVKIAQIEQRLKELLI